LPLSGFSQVELFGLGYAVKLLRRSLHLDAADDPFTTAGWRPAERMALRPSLALDPGGETAVELAAGILRAMSLTKDFAPLVVLIGHGSASTNNPHAAGLDCGACGGHSGVPNARLLAELLNASALRAGLAERGIRIPESTRFIAASHDTTRETVNLIDDAALRGDQRTLFSEIQAAARRASARVREARAPSLGIETGGDNPTRLAAAFERRARDWAQTRPEWGLAGNAAFIVAPRARTQGLDLRGQVFLHEYQPQDDRDGSILAQIMTAPMVVAHWINLQYYSSTTANPIFGSGNKLLHNVVGGGIGVFEGNGGDLRIGLPLQSLHDGRRWIHIPRRLTTVVEAPRERIEAVLEAHADVRNLIINEWLFLVRLDPANGKLEMYRAGTWRKFDGEGR